MVSAIIEQTNSVLQFSHFIRLFIIFFIEIKLDDLNMSVALPVKKNYTKKVETNLFWTDFD